MTESEAASWKLGGWALALAVTLCGCSGVGPDQASPAAAGAHRLPSREPMAAGLAVPRIAGRLQAGDIGLVINSADPYSLQVGAHYARARGLAPSQVLRLTLPQRATLTRQEFEDLRRAIDAHFGRDTQALALAWVAPHAVECNSITGALALGFDGELCRNTCAASRPSPYFNSASARPFAELGLRPSMLLAAGDVEQARALIDRGVAADAALAAPAARPPVHALMLASSDAARRVRMALYPATGLLREANVAVGTAPEAALAVTPRLLLALTGSVRAPLTPAPQWVAGGLGDHLTSYGGSLADARGQGTVLDWIASGATASHGTVSEPCNHVQKFPHPQVLLRQYVQGSTAIEAYWKSVAWPQQSLFVGEPLAAPFARR